MRDGVDCAARTRPKSSATEIVPSRLTSTIQRTLSKSVVRAGVLTEIAAPWNTRSIDPRASVAASVARCTASRSATSHTVEPTPPTFVTTAAAPASYWSATNTRSPRVAHAVATASPIPLAHPTTTTLAINLLLLCDDRARRARARSARRCRSQEVPRSRRQGCARMLGTWGQLSAAPTRRRCRGSLRPRR